MARRKTNLSNMRMADSARKNRDERNFYADRLTELAVSMFEWKNLPETVNERFLEMTLYRDGKAVFFKDPVIGDVALRCMISGELDIYQNPMRRRAYAVNGYQAELDETNSVMIWNNYLRCATEPYVLLYADRLWNLDRAIDVNANAQKTPCLVTCDESERLTMKNLYMKYEGNEPFIFGTKNVNPNSIKVLSTGAPYVGDKLYQLKTQIWNEALTYLGITNINVQKKERLITDEVMRNQGGIIASRYSRLEMRKKACEEINKMFGLDIDCVYREDYREADDEVMFSGATGEHDMDDMVIDLRTQ